MATEVELSFSGKNGKEEKPYEPGKVEEANLLFRTALIRKTIRCNGFFAYVGCLGTFLLLLFFPLSGLFLYLVYEYSLSFTQFERPFVLVFLAMSVVCLLLAFKFLFFWKNIATAFIHDELNDLSQQQNGGLTDAGPLSKLKRQFEAFTTSGKYFVVKLHISQVVESNIHLWNLRRFYLCSVPVKVTVPMCFILAFECFYTAYGIKKHTTRRKYNYQMALDIVIDLVFIVLPLSVMWFVYHIYININEMFELVVPLSIPMILKMYDLIEEVVRERASKLVIHEQKKNSFNAKRNRLSMYVTVKTENITVQQNRFVPLLVRNILASIKFQFGLLFLVVAVTHLTTFLAIDCNEGTGRTIWKYCVVKVPFCNNMFEPTCNCVVLEMNNHNFTKLPTLVSDMNALKTVKIINGPLKEIPHGFEKLGRLTSFYADNNHLETIPQFSYETNPHLIILQAVSNRIKEVPEVLWHHKGVVQLVLEKNEIRHLPSTVENMESITRLSLMDNELQGVPPSLFNLKFLDKLNLAGNNITTVPHQIMNKRGNGVVDFSFLFLARNRLTVLPNRFFELKCKNLDLRNNSIQALPEWTTDSSIGEHFFLADNPVCTTKSLRALLDKAMLKELERVESVGPKRAYPEGCIRQCAPACLDYFRGDDFCDRWCDVKECKFDNGDC